MHPYDADVSAVYRLDRHDQILSVLHLRTSMSRKHRHVMSLTLPRAGGDDVLPRRARVVRTVWQDHVRYVLAEVRGALVLLETSGWSTSIVVSARRQSTVATVAAATACVVGGVLLAYARAAASARHFLTSPRRVRAMNRVAGTAMVGSGVAAGFALFLVSKVAEEFGQSGALPPGLAAWAPAGAGLMLAVALLLHLEDG